MDLYTMAIYAFFGLTVGLPMAVIVGFCAWLFVSAAYTELTMSDAEREKVIAERRASHERTEALIYGAVIDPIGRSIRAQVLRAERNVRRAERELERMS